MREFQIRIFDKQEEEFLNEEDYAINFVGTIFKACLDEEVFEVLDADMYIVTQYTGLKDKNSVEIYEGDIIKDSSNRLMTVEWDRRVGTSRFIFRVINTIGHIKVGRFINTHEWIMPDDNDIEVVGNIYQNPELLITKR